MNDASELNYASELIDEVVQGVLDEVTNEDLTPVLPRRKGFANPFQYPLVQPFIACFCEQGDLLSQWMAYGKGDAPVSLGFDLSSMSTFGDLPPNTILKKVVYEEPEQRERVRQVTRAWLATAESLLDSEEDLQATHLFPYPAIWALQDALAEEHLHFKNPVFAQEEEWRLIKLVNVHGELRLLEDERLQHRMARLRESLRPLGVQIPDPPSMPSPLGETEGIDIQFRESVIGLVPYVELPLQDRAGVFADRLPLWEVVQGPTTHPELSLESLRMYLDTHGYGFHTNMRASTIPLRQTR